MAVENLGSKEKCFRQKLSLKQLAHNVHIALRVLLKQAIAGKTRGKSDGR